MPPLLHGVACGTMCLYEPRAGSSLSDITVHATPDGADRFRIRGTKMWISGGDHDITPTLSTWSSQPGYFYRSELPVAHHELDLAE